jgi:hypothetical protein
MNVVFPGSVGMLATVDGPPASVSKNRKEQQSNPSTQAFPTQSTAMPADWRKRLESMAA